MFELKKMDVVRPYEAVIIMHPDATEEDQKNLFNKNKSIIEGFNGEVNHVDTWGKRRLANPIAKAQKAYFFHSTFSAGPEAIAELERTMRISDKVLRFVHTRLDEGTNLQKFMESFRNSLEETAKREREREAKFQAKKAARAASGGKGGHGGGPRRDRGDKKGADFEEDFEE